MPNPAPPKVVSLTVLPLYASHLCFAVDGILGSLTAKLGDPVTAFPFTTTYQEIGAKPSPTVPGQPSRLLYDPDHIDGTLGTPLATLRAEPLKAALIKAINARENAYYGKYGNVAYIASEAEKYYSPSIPNSKPNRLQELSKLAHEQNSHLQSHYQADKRAGVVKHTTSTLNSKTHTGGQDKQWGETDAIMEEGSQSISWVPPTSLSTDQKGPEFPRDVPLDPSYYPQVTYDASVDDSKSSGWANEQQTITNTDYGYRWPSIESMAQNERAQISLIDQKFATLMAYQNVDKLKEVLENELWSIDLDVYRLQLAYIDTALLSPIAGSVTGVYKTPGDAVRAGEPVLRVDSLDQILIAGNIIYSGAITIGTIVNIETNQFDSDGQGQMLLFHGEVVAVRGHRQDNEWQVVVRPSSFPGLPLGYQFDYDDTTMVIP